MDFLEGRWYAVGFENLDGQMEWHQIIRYDGEGCWSDEDGEVERLFDPNLQLYVAPDAADAYALQG